MEILPHGEGTDVLLSVIYLNSAAPDGGLLLLDAHPHAAAANGDNAELAAALEAEFARPRPEAPEHVTSRRVLRWRVFVPSYPAGRARELVVFRTGPAWGPVELAGDYLYGPLMEAAVGAGKRAAERTSLRLN